MRALTIISLALLFLANQAVADELTVTDADDNEMFIQHYPADGDLLLLMLVDHDTRRDMFENMLQDINKAGIEIWRADIMRDYFLPRTSETERTLSGKPVKALIDATLRETEKTVVIAAYDRLPLAVLRGIHLWQKSQPDTSRFAGAVLFYPNLFGPAPVAGVKPEFDPVIAVTNYPLVIYQPDTGGLRWRLEETLEALWQNNAPAVAYMVPQVRDWFFMGGLDHGKGDKAATQAIPQQLSLFAGLLQSLPKPQKAINKSYVDNEKARVLELVQLKQPFDAPGFDLSTIEDLRLQSQDYAGKVTLVNFWASWCGPCVEEIPSLNALGKNFDAEDFEIISIDYRETVEEIREFTLRVPVDFPVLMDHDGKTSLLWHVFSFPSSFLVDKQGKVRFSANRAIDWNTAETRQLIKKLIEE